MFIQNINIQINAIDTEISSDLLMFFLMWVALFMLSCKNGLLVVTKYNIFLKDLSFKFFKLKFSICFESGKTNLIFVF